MNQFVAAVVVLLLLMAFPIQSIFDTAFDNREAVFDTIVRSYAEKARIDGHFSSAIITEMKDELSSRLPGLTAAEIEVEVTSTIKYRSDSADDDSQISFSISMPEKKRFIGGLIFGGAVPGNALTHTCAGTVYSELIP